MNYSRHSKHPLIVYTFITLFISILIIFTNYYENKRLVSIYTGSTNDTSTWSMETGCAVTRCDYVINKTKTYKKDHKSSKLVLTNHITKDSMSFYLKSVSTIHNIPNHSYKYIVREDLRVLDSLIENKYIILLSFIIFFLIYYRFKLMLNRNHKLLLTSDKFKLEGKLQKTIAESAYHEMVVPIATIKTAIERINKECSVLVKNDYDLKTKLDRHSTVITSSACSLESVINHMATIKKTRNEGETRSLWEIILLANKNLKVYHTYSNFDYTIDNISLLRNWCALGLANGEILNIFNNLIKNSLEAGANMIVFDARKKIGSNEISIILSDNGNGIEGYGETVFEDDVFKLGFTQKESKSNLKQNTGRLQGLKDDIIGLISVGLPEEIATLETTSSRGIGLYLTKEILRKSDGDIRITSSTSEGTTFVITIIGDTMD